MPREASDERLNDKSSEDLRLRARLILELVKTEKTYVRILEVLVKLFLLPLKQGPDSDILSVEKRKQVFPSALATLFDVHSEFVQKLNQRLTALKEKPPSGDAQPVFYLGDVLLELSPYMKIYPVYVSNFDTQSRLLKEERIVNARFSSFLDRQVALLKDPSFDLPSLLVTPVQRIPRYLMLLRSILRHTPASHPDYQNLMRATSEVEKIVVVIDQKAKDAENIAKMVKVSRIVATVAEVFRGIPEHLFDGGNRRLIKMGLARCGDAIGKEKDARSVCLLLLNDFLVVGNVAKDKKTYDFKRDYALENAQIAVSPKEDDVFFDLVCEGESPLRIYFENVEARKLWFQEMDTAVRETKLRTSTLKRLPNSLHGSRKAVRTPSSTSSGDFDTSPNVQLSQSSGNISQSGSRIGRAIEAVGKAITHRRGKSVAELDPLPASPSESPRTSSLSTTPRGGAPPSPRDSTAPSPRQGKEKPKDKKDDKKDKDKDPQQRRSSGGASPGVPARNQASAPTVSFRRLSSESGFGSDKEKEKEKPKKGHRRTQSSVTSTAAAEKGQTVQVNKPVLRRDSRKQDDSVFVAMSGLQGFDREPTSKSSVFELDWDDI